MYLQMGGYRRWAGAQVKTELEASEFENSLIAAIRWNSDGLVCATAVDANTQQVLMQAWMNRESLLRTLRSGLVVYWSRSRKTLWKKGDTSGNTQRLVCLRLDCDGDSILLEIEPQGVGAACHEGYKSCFFRRWDGSAFVVDTTPIYNPVTEGDKVARDACQHKGCRATK